ncbi:hypothetical protein RN001_010686 [Aquatica leii]|uniref:Uncharacterized protein n=1 Tax=Aquatica leii TaxID=1421715 RepID=A0AAN7Q3G9_9COLE|nr:hypothetical protein RN001_010686 [Aquatica leii]
MDNNAVINELQLEVSSLKKYNCSLKRQIEDNLNESTSMESLLNEENSKLQLLVFNLKMEIKNLCKEKRELMDKLESVVRSKSNVKRTHRSTQTEKNCKDIAIQTVYKTVSNYTQTDLNNKDATTQVVKIAKKVVDEQATAIKNIEESFFNKRQETSKPLKQSKCNSIISMCTTAAANKRSDKSLFKELAEANIDTLSSTSIFPSTLKENMKVSVKNDKPLAPIKQSILILGDSQTRDMGLMLKTLLNKSSVNILNIFKPNALLEDVISDVKKLTREFTSNDYVVIIGGSNNAIMGARMNVKQISTKLRELMNKINIVIMSTPYWHNCKENWVNEVIQQNNSKLYSYLSGSGSQDNFRYIDVNSELATRDFTKHGLHMNSAGKVKLLKRLIQKTNNFTPCSNKFVNVDNLVYVPIREMANDMHSIPFLEKNILQKTKP